MSAGSYSMCLLDSGFPQPSLIWLLRGQEVPGGICHNVVIISRDSMSSPNIRGADLLCCLPNAVWQLLKASVQLYCTPHLFLGSSRLHPLIPDWSIRPASSSSPEISLSAAVLFSSLCPSPSQVYDIRSASHAFNLHDLPIPPHHWKLRNCSDCVWLHPTSPQMFVQALRISIPHFQHFSYLPASG